MVDAHTHTHTIVFLANVFLSRPIKKNGIKQYGKVWELISKKKEKKYMYNYSISIGYAFVASSLDSAFSHQFTHNSGARWALKFCDGYRNRRISRGPNLIDRYETRQNEELTRTIRYATIKTIWYTTAILKGWTPGASERATPIYVFYKSRY